MPLRPFRPLLLLCLALAFAQAEPAETTLEPVTLQLKWKHQFQFAGYYAALEKGYYRDAGFDVTIREVTQGINPVEEVLRGKAEFGVGNSDLLLYRHLGEPVVVLGVLLQHSPLRILARADRVQNVHDLVGRNVMLEDHAAELQAYLQRERIDLASLRQVPQSFRPDEFLIGEVDAISAYLTNEPDILRKAGLAYMEFAPQSAGIDFYGDNLFTLERLIKEQPERVAAFRAASFKGWTYAMQHPREIVELILAHWSPQGDREHLLFEAEELRRLIAPNLVEIGYMNPGRWEHIASVYADVGMLPREFSLAGFLYDPSRARDLSRLYPYLTAALATTLVIVGFVLYTLLLNRRIRGSERRYRTVYENAPLAILLWGQDRRISGWNRAAERIFGWRREEVAGRDILEFMVPEEERTPLLAEINTALNGAGPTQARHWNRTKEGKPVLCDWVHTALCDENGCMTVVALALDVTAKVRGEEELRQARAEAEAASQAKSEFLANMSHEIRTPMNGVIGMTSLLLDTRLDPGQREYVETIRRSGEVLLALINNILDHAKIEAGRMEMEREPFDLHDCAQGVMALVAPGATERHARLELRINPGVPRYLTGDRLRIHQILSNLLGNAVKFTENGEVTLSLDGRDEGDRFALEMVVRDSGIGIPPDRMDRLFQNFSQLDASTTRLFGGTGLGLAITRRLVELMGGTIAAESEGEGKGACFRVLLRLEKAPPPAGAATAVEEQAAPGLDGGFAARHPLRILAVDDLEVNRRVTRLMLERLGYAPELADGGMAAVEACRRRPFDLVLMDIQMPDLDGERAAAQIRREAPEGSVPRLVAMTANALPGDRERYLAAGFDGYLSKPVEFETLAEALADAGPQAPRTTENRLIAEPAAAIHLPTLRRRMPEQEPYRSLFFNLLTVFREDAERRLALARTAATGGDPQQIRFHMHALKGAAGTLGALRLASLCEETESLARDSDPTAAERLPEIEREYRRVRDEIALLTAQERQTQV